MKAAIFNLQPGLSCTIAKLLLYKGTSLHQTNISCYLLLIEKGRLSPGGGKPSPPLLRAEVVKVRTEAKPRAARAIAIV